jgi:predicted GIY-YIG superfamily endonuclease
MDKEFLYIGHYVDINNNYILKIGTTNNLERRAKEHTRNYKLSPHYTMPAGATFIYDWSIPLSKYSTLRYEDSNREKWKIANYGEFVRNDRFCCERKPDFVEVTIRKTYRVALA